MGQPAFRIVTKPTFRDLQGRFAQAEKELLEARRDLLRGEGEYLKADFIRRLRAKIGPSKIERGIKYNTRQTGDRVKLNVTGPERSRPHVIRAKNAAALAFFWPKVGRQTFVPRAGGFPTHVSSNGALFIGKGQVDHPGGPLGPLLVPILKDVSEDWQRGRGRIVLNRISTRYVSKLEGR